MKQVECLWTITTENRTGRFILIYYSSQVTVSERSQILKNLKNKIIEITDNKSGECGETKD